MDIQCLAMALVKKLTKIGNSLALIIDRPVLDLLHIPIDAPLEISTPDGKKLEITPLTEAQYKRRRREK
jgi:antitoxin MazE